MSKHTHSFIEVIPDHYVGPYVSCTLHVREKNKDDIGITCLQDYLECRLTTLTTINKLAAIAKATE